MDFLERDLEDIIFNSEQYKLRQRGLEIYGVVKRQLIIGNYGIADLVSFYKDYEYVSYESKVVPVLIVDVFELKKGNVDLSTFAQALRYCKGLSRYFYDVKKCKIPIVFNINLVGKDIDKRSDILYLTDLIESKEIGSISKINLYTYSYELEGLTFMKHKEYCLKNEGF